ncbi:unnamed protein product [Adineta ricciae]|uniref:Uncharacterized protein n=1 Tax=Adineta ricciae TaxID=249248 RepID=A0A815T9Q6_ADIRI|nr:unnamed protein product [Adineta ricciae]CAF1500831.1 unnamed protein product [Adineta ricciae]
MHRIVSVETLKKMMQQDRATQTDVRRRSRKFFGLTVKDILTLTTSLIVPLLLGVSTIITTSNYQKEAIRQSKRDSSLREQEWQIENSRNERQWNIANKQNQFQQYIAHEKYRDEMLISYIKETGDLLNENNGSLTSNPIIASIVRSKTLNTIRQLDPLRISYAIRFLIESGQLTVTNETKALNISTVELFNISKDIFQTLPTVGKLSLSGIYLHNCTLNDTFLHNIDFSFVQLDYINFSANEFRNSVISSAKLNNIDFSFGKFKNVDFSSSQLEEVNFSSTHFEHAHQSCNRFGNIKNLFAHSVDINFASTTLKYVDFSFSRLQYVNFQSANLNNVRFTSARIENTIFQFSTLYNVDFSFTTLSHIDFSHTYLENVNFSFAKLDNVDFESAQLMNVDFSSAILRNVNFSDAVLFGVQFSFAVLVLVNFEDTIMPSSSFMQTRRMDVNFDRADLVESIFCHANARAARFYSSDLTRVNFTSANLQRAKFINTTIMENQLKSTLSIHDAQLPDGTLGRDSNLIMNGDANCNSPISQNWQLKVGNIMVMMSDQAKNNCYFGLESYSIGAVIAQSINLSSVWDSHMWSHSQAVLNAKMGKGVSIQLNGIDSNGKLIDQRNLNLSGNNLIIRLQEAMQTLEIVVQFHIVSNRTHLNRSWCDDIQLFIDYDTQSWSSQTLPLRASSNDIPTDAKWNQDGLTVAGGLGQGNESDQLFNPAGLYVDDDDTIYIADEKNHRIMKWKCNGTTGQVVAGGNGPGNGADQLNSPNDVIVDKERNCLIICDGKNRRVIRWPLRNSGNASGETLISNISCWGLTMDYDGNLYVVENEKHKVIRYRIENGSEGTVVAGEYIEENDYNTLSFPVFIFIDGNRSIYISDEDNHRVVRWEHGAKEGTVVAGGNGNGNSLTQLSYPQGVVVDHLGAVYVADDMNHRVMRWTNGSRQGSIIAGGHGRGKQMNQLNYPNGLSFDRHGNLYVSDMYNHRIQKFLLE